MVTDGHWGTSATDENNRKAAISDRTYDSISRCPRFSHAYNVVTLFTGMLYAYTGGHLFRRQFTGNHWHFLIFLAVAVPLVPLQLHATLYVHVSLGQPQGRLCYRQEFQREKGTPP